MIDVSPLYEALKDVQCRRWLDRLPAQLATIRNASLHGDFDKWQGVLRRLPRIRPSSVELNADSVRIGGVDDSDEEARRHIEDGLRQLHPWRKGPYTVHAVHIDAEWRSDLKWRRLCDHIEPLEGRTVLDVGSGNGYHCWRMRGAGARLVIGIDPTALNLVQFSAIRHFAGDHPVYLLPLRIEDMPPKLGAFDTVFSMGVLYHRRSPIDHLLELRGLLRSGGQLVLETLVIDEEIGPVLVPEDRYALMRNVWFIPSCRTLLGWLKRCSYRDVRLVHSARTTPEEQRSTDWMRFQSLPDFLDPRDSGLTREGLPAPCRAILLATSP
jgi:tRNA (mo5U34)-methyltransferase